MKKLIPMLMLSLSAVTMSAQEQTDYLYINLADGQVVKYAVSEISSMGFTDNMTPDNETPEFPEPDNSTEFNRLDPAASVKMLLEKAGTECTDTLGRIVITKEQYNEIKTFTDNLVSGSTTPYGIYYKCFTWITSNVKYVDGYVDNNPYQVFKTKTAICQGYANLLHVMMRTQGIPAMVVNGYLQSSIYDGMLVGGGHAWNYVCCDGVWYVSDATNKFQYKMSDLSQYKSMLAPTSMDVVVFKEADSWVNFNECRLNICKVTTDKSYYVTPYSTNGFKITCFNPFEALPSNVREIYIGENIESLGDNSVGLDIYAPNVEFVSVAPGNKNYVSHAGVVYYSKNYVPVEYWVAVDRNVPAYIPAALKSLELYANDVPAGGIVYGKNAIYKVNGVEEIRFPEETAKLESFAVEQCPNLKVAYLPKDAEVSSNAFYNVHKDFKIERY